MAISIFLIAISAAGENRLTTVWRVSFGIGIFLPILVFAFRLRMLSSKLYKKGAIKRTSNAVFQFFKNFNMYIQIMSRIG